MAESETLIRFGNGATRSAGTPPYHMLPKEGLDYAAARFADGAPTHGDWNWTLGMPIDETFNHAIGHFFDLIQGNFTKDSAKQAIGAVLFAGFNLAWYHVHHPELFEKLTPQERAKLSAKIIEERRKAAGDVP